MLVHILPIMSPAFFFIHLLLLGDLIITGRFKDVIVLSNGENVAPEPIEDSIVGSSTLVDQVRALYVGTIW